MLIILFGKPAVGKNFVGSILEKKFGFYFYDMDKYISKKLQNKIQNNQVVTEKERDNFYLELVGEINNLKAKYKNLVISQAFLKNKHRRMYKEKFPDSIWVYLTCDEINRLDRLALRQHIISLEYDKKIQKLWQEPEIEYIIFQNNKGEKEIISQIKNKLRL